MDYSKIIDFLKQPQFVFVLAVTTGLIIFFPDSVVQKMGLYQSRSTFLPYISIIFLVSTVLFITQMSAKGFTWNKERRKKESDLRSRLKGLETLTKEERVILRRFIECQTMTQRLDVDSGIVNGLMLKGIIYRATERATSGFADQNYYGRVYGCDHNMQPWAWEYLIEHPHLLSIQEENANKAEEAIENDET
jgi:hypothetical protein